MTDRARDPEFVALLADSDDRFVGEPLAPKGRHDALAALGRRRSGWNGKALLDAVARDGFSRGYRRIRIAKSDRHFRIEEAVVRQPERDGRVVGQAAFSRWRDL